MKFIFLISILLLSFLNLFAQTPCGDLAAQQGRWVQTPPIGKDAQAVKNINTAMSLFQKSVVGFTGGQAKTYTFTADLVDVPTKKIQAATAAMFFLKYECINGAIKPEAETGTWFYVGFNEFPFFKSNNAVGVLKDCAESFYCLPNGQQMFFSQYQLKGDFKGYSKLIPLHHLDGEAVLLSKNGRLPLRSATQAEVLVEYKKSINRKKGEYIKQLENNLAKEPADLARMDADKQMAGREESKKALIASNNQTRATVAKLKNELAVCNATIDSYIAKPIAKQPASVEVIDDYCNPEKMFNPTNHVKQIVVFDESYFDKNLATASPQFIVVYWRKGDAGRFPVKKEFINKFEQNFDFSALKNMLGK